MSFTFEARTLLELGKELISSDEVAIYELIKNSVDAGSPKVEILLTIRLVHSDYKEALAKLEEERKSLDDVLDFIRKSVLDQDDPETERMMQALARADDRRQFGKRLRSFYAQLNTIEVRDFGEGMSLADLRNIYLRVGTRSRRQQNMDGAQNLGDKGIGRLSAMRLGERLEVKTSKAGETYWNMLDIDWSMFSHDEARSLEDIVIEPVQGEEKTSRSEKGTSVMISSLQSDWTEARFQDVLQGRIARMVDPFEAGAANRLIVARHNGTRLAIPSIPRKLLDAAHAYCHVDFSMVDGEPVLQGSVNYRYRHRSARIDERGASVYSLAQNAIKRRAKRGHAAFRLVPVRPSAFEDLGSFSCDIYWFNRRVVEAVSGLTEKMADTRREISHWSGGPMLYRYGFRILPYGDPSNDWLDLDENAFGVSGFKLNRQQVIGRVLLQTPHTALSEQTNREGLIQSNAADALRKILMWVVHTEMRGLINDADEIERIERRAADEDTKRVSNAQERVERSLDRLRKSVGPAGQKQLDDLGSSIELLGSQSSALVARIEKVLQEADQEREKFVYLAGIGLMTEFIFHELERAVTHTMDLLSGGSLRQATIDSLKEQLKTLHKRIAAFDELTGEKRQSKSNFDLGDLIDDVLSNHQREFERHGIAIRFEQPARPMVVKAVRGMMIQIIENLVVNAAYWLKQQKRFEDDFEPELTVVLDTTDKTLTIEDNGPGVLADRKERIFQPFVTTKPTGQGRGLGLYIGRELAEYHGWKLYMDPEVGRIREGRLNMFVLDMG